MSTADYTSAECQDKATIAFEKATSTYNASQNLHNGSIRLTDGKSKDAGWGPFQKLTWWATVDNGLEVDKSESNAGLGKMWFKSDRNHHDPYDDETIKELSGTLYYSQAALQTSKSQGTGRQLTLPLR